MSRIDTQDRTITSEITPELVALLDHAEAMWRLTVGLDSPEACWAGLVPNSLYAIADTALESLLVRGYGADGAAVREQMADNFEGWAYNVRVVADQKAYEAAVCDECGWPNNTHEDGCKDDA